MTAIENDGTYTFINRNDGPQTQSLTKYDNGTLVNILWQKQLAIIIGIVAYDVKYGYMFYAWCGDRIVQIENNAFEVV